jgi:uncharacterized protein YdeI (BOF family)
MVRMKYLLAFIIMVAIIALAVGYVTKPSPPPQPQPGEGGYQDISPEPEQIARSQSMSPKQNEWVRVCLYSPQVCLER